MDLLLINAFICLSQHPGESRTVYQIIVKTGNKSFAGTDANVYIQLHGKKGQKTPRLSLDDEKNNFEKGQIDVFKVC